MLVPHVKGCMCCTDCVQQTTIKKLEAENKVLGDLCAEYDREACTYFMELALRQSGSPPSPEISNDRATNQEILRLKHENARLSNRLSRVQKYTNGCCLCDHCDEHDYQKPCPECQKLLINIFGEEENEL